MHTGTWQDDIGELATQSDAHREWHRNTGTPMGQPGCPQDACHPADDKPADEPTASEGDSPASSSAPPRPNHVCDASCNWCDVPF